MRDYGIAGRLRHCEIAELRNRKCVAIGSLNFTVSQSRIFAFSRFRNLALLILVAAAALSCRQDMFDQPKLRPLQASTFFEDGRASRPLPEDTVPRGAPLGDDLLSTGRVAGEVVDRFPFPITAAILDRGQERFDVFCSPCHGRTGNGDGMIVQRGFKVPPSFNSDRLRQAPAGHFFEVMTRGFGVMYDYRSRITPEDRWAIAAYIRALQLSQHAGADDLDAAKAEAAQAAAARKAGTAPARDAGGKPAKDAPR
jgi:mono/diheme cytochrome c family protein